MKPWGNSLNDFLGCKRMLTLMQILPENVQYNSAIVGIILTKGRAII